MLLDFVLRLGFDEATPDDFIEVDADLNTITGKGMANPATRFHLWVYEARPQTNAIIHTHSPYVSALVAARQPLVVAQMDMTPLYNDCAFLAEWPGVPIADQEAYSFRRRSATSVASCSPIMGN